MEFKKFSRSLFGFKRREVADYIQRQNDIYYTELEQMRKTARDTEKRLTEENERLVAERDKYSSQSHILASEVKRLRTVSDELDGRCNRLSEALVTVSHERDDLTERYEKTFENNRSLLSRCATLEGSVKTLSERVVAAEATLKRGYNELERTRRDLKTLALEYSSLQKDATSAKHETEVQREVLVQCIADIKEKNEQKVVQTPETVAEPRKRETALSTPFSLNFDYKAETVSLRRSERKTPPPIISSISAHFNSISPFGRHHIFRRAYPLALGDWAT